jgi:hypothetical protein
MEKPREDYEVIEFTSQDYFWHEYYEPFKEFMIIIKEAAVFLLNDSRW